MNTAPHPQPSPHPEEPSGPALPGSVGGGPAPVQIPDHKLIRPIGAGSYGQVWLAQNMMGRYRAVKVLFRESFKDHRPFDRELAGIRRFEPISRSHEGFVDILQIGINEAAGYCYYVMELGDDQTRGADVAPDAFTPRTLASDIRAHQRLGLEACLRLGIALSQALAHLHHHGLLHRDIKPSNIIFVNGVPKLADIGLVVEVGGPASYVGTEGYIPPEGPSSAQADIFALGKVLYEAVTGKDRHEFPALPVDWELSPQREGLLELNEILVRACQPLAARRYLSATDLYADLVVITNGKSVKRLHALERRWANLKRGAGLFTLAAGLAGAIIHPLYREHRLAVEGRERQIGADIANGNRAMESGDLLAALPSFVEAMRLDNGPADRLEDHRLRIGSVLAQCPKLLAAWQVPGEVDSAHFSPEGGRVLVISHHGSEEVMHGQARVFDAGTGAALTPPFGAERGLYRGGFSPDGRVVVTASQTSAAAFLWRAIDGTLLAEIPHPCKVLAASFSPDGRRLVTAGVDAVTRIWDAETHVCEREIHGHLSPVVVAGFSPGGRLVATASYDRTVRVWDAATGREVCSALLHSNWVTGVAFSPDGRTLVTSCADHTAHLWETETGRPLPPDIEHGDAVMRAEFSPDGRLIATLDRAVRLWSVSSHQALNPNPILRQGQRVTALSFNPDGHRILTAGQDGVITVWDLARGMPTRLGREPTPSVAGANFLTTNATGLQVFDALSERAVSPRIRPDYPLVAARLEGSGRFILTSLNLAAVPARAEAMPGALAVWESSTGRRLGPLLPLTNTLATVALSPDGRRLVAFDGGVAQSWDVLSASPLVRAVPHPQPITLVRFSPNHHTVASAAGALVRVWDADTGSDLFPPLAQPPTATALAFDANGTRLVTCGQDATLDPCYAQVWNVATGQRMGAPLWHQDGVVCAAFSPDSARVVTGSEDFTGALWETATGRRLAGNLAHLEQLHAVAFSPDGRWVLTAGLDRAVRIWNARTGEPVTPPWRFLRRVWTADFLPDGRHIVVHDGRLNAWKTTLALDQRPVADLVQLSQVLNLSPGPDPGGRDPESAAAHWQRLRQLFPADFSVSAEEVYSWHQFQAELAERESRWFTAIFHLERLRVLQPGDDDLANRLARARQGLKPNL